MGRTTAEIERETVEWYRQLIETNNWTFVPLFFDHSRYLVLKGGGGSGKSIFAGRKVLERVTTEPGHRWLVCRKVAKTLRNSCFEQLLGQIAEYYTQYLESVNKSDMVITFKNGSKILFAGLDDVEKLKSIYDITGIWIEEASELEETDFEQLDIRLRTVFPYYLQIIITFNPISITHWLKKRFWDRHDPRAMVHESTYKDNRFLIQEAIETLEAFAETDEYYFMVYCLGQWGVTGKTVFNGKAVSQRLTQIRPPVKRGYFDIALLADNVHINRWTFTSAADGALKIYEEPKAGRPYVIGGDTAGEGSDYFVAQVIDNVTGKQVATLRHQYDEDTYAYQLYALGMYYNTALVGNEVNYSTFPTKMLEILGYPNMYVREIEDTFTGKTRQAYGFQTNKITRPLIIANLIRIVREDITLINDEDTLLEMLTFVRNEKLRPEAEPGAHDDTVMALAITYYIRGQQATTENGGAGGKRTKWSEDMWQDYYNTDAAGRAALVQMWGTPE